MIHKGFLHRDIGTAGVFRLTDPTQMKPFAPGDFKVILGDIQAGMDDQVLQDQVSRLRRAITDLEIAEICCGVVQPSDVSVEMKDYYASGGSPHQPVSVSCCGITTSQLLQHSHRTIMSSCLLGF